MTALVVFARGATFVVLFALEAALWAGLVRARLHSPAAVLVAFIALRSIAFIPEPALSGDVYRYLWDGKVLASGADPYAHSPSDPRLSHLREPWHSKINHAGIRTIYPPAAQALFGVNALLGGTLHGWRALLLLFDLLTLVLLRTHYGDRAAFAWAACPLVLVEGFWSAHLEVCSASLLLSAVVIRRWRPFVAGAILGTAAAVKLIPAAAFPALLRGEGASPPRSGRRWLFAAGFACVVVAASLPGIVPGLSEYARRWVFNSPFYESVYALVDLSSLPDALKAAWTAVKDPLRLEGISRAVYSHLDPDFVTRAILMAAFLTGVAVIVARSRSFPRAAANSVGVLLLCSPAIHPWYWLTLLPIAIGERMWFWVAIAMAAPASYLLYEGVDARLVYLISYGLPVIGWLVLRRVTSDE